MSIVFKLDDHPRRKALLEQLQKIKDGLSVPIRDGAEVERLTIQYCTNLTTIFQQMQESLGVQRAADTIRDAAKAASEDHEMDKRSG